MSHSFCVFSPGSISSEEIIKYAHRISASNAVCAPLNWVPGKRTVFHLFISFTIHVISSETCSVIFVSSCDVCVGDPRRPYPTDLEMRSGILGNMSNMSTNGVNGHLPGDALAAGRLPGRFTPLFHPSALFCLPGCLYLTNIVVCVWLCFSVEVQNVSLMFIFC